MYDREENFIYPSDSLEMKMGRRDAFKSAYLRAYPDHSVSPEDSHVIWYLGLGKSGTTTISKILNLCEDIVAYHELPPRLWRFDKEVFNSGCQPGTWDKVLYASRSDIVEEINSQDKVFCEVNNRTTFFAPAVKRVYAKAKFIFNIRELDEFVESAYWWGLFGEFDRYQDVRVNAGGHTRREKIASMWCMTNKYALDFLETIDDADKFFITHNDLKTVNVKKFEKMFKKFSLRVPTESELVATLSTHYNKSKHKEPLTKNWQEYDEQATEIYRRIGYDRTK